jgi:putative membrane protein insertion efficiency factor
MPWVRRRYDPRYYDPYAYRGRRPRYGGGNSCLRDACLLETGCCVAEAIDGNCLISALLLLPRFVTTTMSAAHDRTRRNRAAAAMLGAIRVYQRDISAHRAPCCRFSPSCSEYAVQAIEWHGAVRGAMLAARRLIRCRPGGARGADPVPA